VCPYGWELPARHNEKSLTALARQAYHNDVLAFWKVPLNAVKVDTEGVSYITNNAVTSQNVAYLRVNQIGIYDYGSAKTNPYSIRCIKSDL